MTRRMSTNDAAKAMENSASTPQQNRTMELIMMDFVDIINQIHEMVEPMPAIPKTADELQESVTRAAFKLRAIRAALGQLPEEK